MEARLDPTNAREGEATLCFPTAIVPDHLENVQLEQYKTATCEQNLQDHTLEFHRCLVTLWMTPGERCSRFADLPSHPAALGEGKPSRFLFKPPREISMVASLFVSPEVSASGPSLAPIANLVDSTTTSIDQSLAGAMSPPVSIAHSCVAEAQTFTAEKTPTTCTYSAKWKRVAKEWALSRLRSRFWAIKARE
jgi:hypothetical protein